MSHKNTQEGNKLTQRLAKYAGDILRLLAEIPDTKEGRLVKDQLGRSATAPGAHYAEARSAQSSRDFIHKLSLAAKEARESQHWLLTLRHAGYTTSDVESLVGEAEEITAILAASLQTARRNRDGRRER